MSLVPIVAVAFAIVKDSDSQRASPKTSTPSSRRIPRSSTTSFASLKTPLARTQGGVVAAVALVTLFWAVIRVFGSTESAFNNIWEVKVERSITRQWTDYIAVVMIVPIL